ncbi:MAG: phosphoserine phosphatase SerB [Pseudomonadales bacterium]|uniref:phosphoserine phosphatase SerB n=1 Tax=unclassified Ketobacter TaxID=2639109 RepID=UPI000C969882|nr:MULTISPECIES: phosphoserine phosphatase SerB [unclassified Ketobacter]MAQ24005.1 phosphoserine phosphatase SerB [Pseudomonadales bacterium]TNC90867.1 MAG: phosphoserine phosphatase SerB [Alcanivorax sp.]HAG95800.1 phosphoserine phosphatase SerB [Gammaproteobacteria bacterium]RLT87829.1 MAG: phosphoserine phosphatase SerB [Ketobacter sp. GenoA1]RLT96507.1 MAG: phosphoserine phosphatase SerB [Ketobacter sp.]
MHDILLINISGPDKPGVTSTITDLLARYDVNVLDIGQAVIHDTLTLGMVVEVPPGSESSSVLKDVLFACHGMGMAVRFTPIDEAEYEEWVQGQGKDRFIVTILARKITAKHIAAVTSIVAGHNLNIDHINRLSGRISLGEQSLDQKACVELSVRGAPSDITRMRAQFLAAAGDLGVDIAFQKDNAYRRNRRLVCFDMDSTLIEAEVIDELAKAAGVGAEVSAITELAMAGELDFTQSFKRRVGLLKGLDESVLEGIARNLPVTEGAEDLIRALKALGYKTAILSGGFTYFGRYLQQKLGIDYVYANELQIENGKVTGEVKGQVVDGQRKAELLKQLAEKENLNLQQVIAVGDGANDLPMLSLAGLGIAFRAKPLVKQSADHAISELGLDGILYLLGVRDRDSEELLTRT